MPALKIGGLILIVTFGTAAFARQAAEEKKTLENYLTDVNAGPVSAASLAGVAKTAITNVQTSQDLILAVNPFSSGGEKKSFGLAITPARTSITPMSGQTYYSGGPLYRLLGSLTVSYAENESKIDAASYAKQAYALDSTLYLNAAEDPVFEAYAAYKNCPERKAIEDEMLGAAQAGNQALFDTLGKKAGDATAACVAAALKKTAWNASRVMFNYADGRIKPVAGGASHSLGKTVALTGLFKLGDNSAAYLLLRRTSDAVDLKTLATTASLSDSTIAAVRFTSGSTGDKALRWLIEASNAKNSKGTTADDIYKYAVGIDKKVMDGVWLEFRFGKAKKPGGTTTENKGLLTLN